MTGLKISPRLRAAIRRHSYKACPECSNVMTCVAVRDGVRTLDFICPVCHLMVSEHARPRRAA
jgi:hypothetical protein